MHMPRLAAFALLATTVLGQGVIVSPVGTTNVEGSGSNAFPWTSTVVRRYMQLHGDLGTTPLLITMLSFRASAAASLATGTRIHDIELYLGEGRPALQPSMTFDNNYIGGKTLVIPRTLITFGPQGQLVTPGPNPFTGNMDLVLPAPFLYTAANPSLVWEVAYYGQTTGVSGTFGTADVEQGVVTTATSTITGTGCVATGQGAAMTHTFTVNDTAGTLVMNATVTAAPASTLCFLAFGFTNPNSTVPGLCANVYSDAIAVSSIGFSDAAGAITTTTPTATTFSLPNNFVGLPICTQVFAIDSARVDPIPFCASNGRQSIVPASNLTRVNEVSRLVNNAGGTTATESVWFGSTIGYGLVTQFSHL